MYWWRSELNKGLSTNDMEQVERAKAKLIEHVNAHEILIKTLNRYSGTNNFEFQKQAASFVPKFLVEFK
jgi:hypothetical protein